MVTRRKKVLEAALQDIFFFPVKVKGAFMLMQDTPHFSEVVVSSAKISDAAASSLMNTQ